MAKTDGLLKSFQRAYDEARQKEQEELYDAIAEVLAEQKASIPNTLMVLELIRFELLQAKYREVIEGTIKLTDKPPIAVKPKKEE